MLLILTRRTGVRKRRGFGDIQIARALKITEGEVRKARVAHGVEVSMKRVDTCAAEFEAETPVHVLVV